MICVTHQMSFARVVANRVFLWIKARSSNRIRHASSSTARGPSIQSWFSARSWGTDRPRASPGIFMQRCEDGSGVAVEPDEVPRAALARLNLRPAVDLEIDDQRGGSRVAAKNRVHRWAGGQHGGQFADAGIMAEHHDNGVCRRLQNCQHTVGPGLVERGLDPKRRACFQRGACDQFPCLTSAGGGGAEHLLGLIAPVGDPVAERVG